MQRKHRSDTQQEIEPGQCQEKLPHSHQDSVCPSTVKARQRPGHRSKRQGNHRRQQSAQYRDTSAVEDSREHVAAEAIGAAKKKEAWLADTKQAAVCEKSDGVNTRTVLAILPGRQLLHVAIDERPQMKTALRVKHADARGRG